MEIVLVFNSKNAQPWTKGPQLSQEELEGFSPTAAAAVKLLKSGMTLTEMFSEYIEKSKLMDGTFAG